MRTRSLLVVTVVGLLTLGIAMPASAAGPGESTATVRVTGGSLSITVPTDAGNLGTRANSVLGGTISGALGPVQVNDAGAVALSPGCAPAAPTTQADLLAARSASLTTGVNRPVYPLTTDATGAARSAAGAVTLITVKVSCPRTHRGAGGLLYCDRRDRRP
jgi:hypothetical protein